jgi:tetratricopeptide (TPR) repeat protein/class 3 adenylate cyclase
MPATRKLAAIVFTHIAEYSSMMVKDESSTLRVLDELRKIFYPLVQQHNGKVLKEMGDSTLLSFDSAVDAVNCTTLLQRNIKHLQQLKLRISIHLGDVVVEERDVFGEGVNIAARIQRLASPGGIIVTEDVWKQSKNQPDIGYISLGTHRLKGVSNTVKVYALNGDGIALPSLQQRISSQPAVKLSMIAFVVFIIAGITYFLTPIFHTKESEGVPSIAILYIKNLGDANDEPYSYGITQDLIVDIAKAGLVRVSSMNDILSIQKSELPIDKIAQILQVRYVMDGSLKREGDIFRLSAQVVEAATRKTLWADRIEAKIDESVSLQGRVAKAIINALHLTPSTIVVKEITTPRTTNTEAYEFYLRGKFLFDRKKSKTDVSVARGLYEKAVGLDSSFVSSLIGLAETYDLEGDYDKAEHLLEKGLSIAQRNNDIMQQAECLRWLGNIYWEQSDYARALTFYERGLKLFEESGDINGVNKTFNNIGNIYWGLGKYTEALESYSKDLKYRETSGDRKGEAISLNNIGLVHSEQGDYTKSLEYFLRGLKIMKEVGSRQEEGIIMDNIGSVYNNQGDYKKAIEYFLMDLKINQELGDRQGEGPTLYNLASAYLNLDDYLSASEYCTKSLKISRDIGDRSTEGFTLHLQGLLWFKQQKYHAARDSFKQAIEVFRQIETKQNIMWATSWLALTEMKLMNHNIAEEIVRTVKGMFPEIPKPKDYIEICWNISQTYQSLGNSQKAKEFLEKAFSEVTSRANKISDSTIRKSFLTNVQTNGEVISEWNKSKQTSQSD